MVGRLPRLSSLQCGQGCLAFLTHCVARDRTFRFYLASRQVQGLGRWGLLKKVLKALVPQIPGHVFVLEVELICYSSGKADSPRGVQAVSG